VVKELFIFEGVTVSHHNAKQVSLVSIQLFASLHVICLLVQSLITFILVIDSEDAGEKLEAALKLIKWPLPALRRHFVEEND
jgi:hypothetical protein